MTEEEGEGVLAEVLAGLAAPQKRLPAKYFYDARGSALFERITRLPEYYLTDCELEILDRRGPEVAEWMGPEVVLLELGSGSSEKIGRLIPHLIRPRLYVPVDISAAALEGLVRVLAARWPELPVQPVCADFTAPLSVPGFAEAPRRVLFYPGSTIGNLEPAAAEAFLARLRITHLVPGDGLLLGADLVKDLAILEAAYDDAAGVTAAFNRNLLHHLNRRIGSDFVPEAFEHLAFYDSSRDRIEMHLRATEPQRVTVGGEAFSFARGETLHTESSYKYTRPGMVRMAERAGYVEERFWTDARGWFGVWYFRARGDR